MTISPYASCLLVKVSTEAALALALDPLSLCLPFLWASTLMAAARSWVESWPLRGSRWQLRKDLKSRLHQV